MSSQPITTRITAAEDVAGQIRAYTLEATDGSELPDFSAGAHIDVLLGNDLIRQYSLCSDPAERHHYRIAVLHEPDGRGGSDYMHRQLKAGDELKIHGPRNHFELDMSGDNYLLLAGGIGITPIMLMALQLQAAGKPFTLHYLCRTPEQAAFRHWLEETFGSAVEFHYSYGDAAKRLDLRALFSLQNQPTRVYTCGSEGLLQAILDAAESLPDIEVNFERFSAAPVADDAVSEAFEIEIASSGETLQVGEAQTILEVLQDAGHEIETMCKEGLCGSCEVDLLEGEADHRDSVLNDAEKAEQNVLMVCCSRARTPRLKLDL
ncbi:PDR/VanB family oxidoreductase [Aliamphritea hakodatensis]|uniref:PDR/VanB family oxidoreductase n=1 Tax=Aliamphritea hakodatensis TaxID=2895352 RepID=UPI0022FDA75B|nr:PDR/VanB family oxidoreductase [Aliamphritea hakodatensis]